MIKKRLINSMLLSGLIIAIPLHAETNGTYYGKKTARVAGYLAEIGCGIIFGVHDLRMHVSSFLQRKRYTPYCCRPLWGSCKHDELLVVPRFAIATAALIGHGLYGLNKEFEIIDQIKHLYRKKAADKEHEKK